MNRRRMNNTEIDCLKWLVAVGWVAPITIAVMMWPRSRQRQKKTETIRRHLDNLVRQGYAHRYANAYGPTPAGIAAAATASQQNRPTTLRIAR
jgi:NADPH-dependent 2,4-dienoyl-CoA reductase/sulfur reductase-like enzyme